MSQKAVNANTQQSAPDPALKKLEVFVGKWNTVGWQVEGLVGPAAEITALDTFEWLPGEMFLVHRFEGKVGESDVACIEVTGYDAENKNYPVNTFYNNGIANQWEYSEIDGVWTMTGDWQMEGKKMQARCTNVFSDDGNSFTGEWEMSSDGSNWEMFWDVTATKEASNVAGK